MSTPASSARITILIGALLLATGAGWLLSDSAGAQCEEPPPSSCSSCHALQHPISTEGEWHCIHCRQDICLNCHGGNGSTMDKDLAHQSMNTQPLSDIYTDCHSCHPDYDERAGRLSAVAGVTPGCSATPTPLPIGAPPPGPPMITANSNLPQLGFTAPLEIAGLTAASLAMLAFFLLSLRWLSTHS